MTALTRWRTRCQAAIETGAGLDHGIQGAPPDWRLARGLQHALGVTAETSDADKARGFVDEAAFRHSCASIGMFMGLRLARYWLDEELAIERFRQNAAEAALAAEASR